MREHEATHPWELRFETFDDALLRTAPRSAMHPSQRQAVARQITELASQQQQFVGLLPKPTYLESNRAHAAEPGQTPSSFGRAMFIKGPIINVDLPPAPLIENTTFEVLVTLASCSPENLSGVLRASVSGGPRLSTPPHVTFPVPHLEKWGVLQIKLMLTAPSAALGHVLRLELLQATSNALLATTEAVFDTAAAYRITIDSAHVYEARSPRNDSLVFNLDQKPGRTHYNDSLLPADAISLGDHGDGDDIVIDRSKVVVLPPTTEPVSICRYFLVNLGDTMSPGEARRLATQISLVFDLFSGGFNAARTAGFDPLIDPVPEHPVTLSVSYAIWYHIIVRVLTLSCNGIVASEEVVFAGAELEAATRGGAEIIETLMFNGHDSPIGCGANSRYSVKRTIKRISLK